MKKTEHEKALKLLDEQLKDLAKMARDAGMSKEQFLKLAEDVYKKIKKEE